MTNLVRIHRKGQMTLPSKFRAVMGVTEGSVVELSLKHGKMVVTPKAVIERSGFPNADGEYTPAQRRVIDRDKEGRSFGPFEKHADFMASLRREASKAGTKKSKRLK